MLDPDGKQVPYQLLENGSKLAVQTDLPANAQKRWEVVSLTKPEAVIDGVKIAEKGSLYEITNGAVGIRIPTSSFVLPPDAKASIDLFFYK